MSTLPSFFTLPALARAVLVSDESLRRRLLDGRLLADAVVDTGSLKAVMPIFAGDRLDEIRMSLRPSSELQVVA